MITNMRERIKEELTLRNRHLGNYMINDYVPSDEIVDGMVKLFNEMLAEEKCGNGS
jgi:hypothetical protein